MEVKLRLKLGGRDGLDRASRQCLGESEGGVFPYMLETASVAASIVHHAARTPGDGINSPTEGVAPVKSSHQASISNLAGCVSHREHHTYPSELPHLPELAAPCFNKLLGVDKYISSLGLVSILSSSAPTFIAPSNGTDVMCWDMSELLCHRNHHGLKNRSSSDIKSIGLPFWLELLSHEQNAGLAKPVLFQGSRRLTDIGCYRQQNGDPSSYAVSSSTACHQLSIAIADGLVAKGINRPFSICTPAGTTGTKSHLEDGRSDYLQQTP
ncbi:hypothetical protein B0H65DRAFT_445462 [Neurospora tetraspora]|uniref:Uncharacterized protein n=1 Tax=Neurospora tetraspora TaxID=94610 RepID=A0AAE0J9R9_9PEZI|nr:hypothetical protein B0H65DRAFT_445462 [Neurospora tetraspora]